MVTHIVARVLVFDSKKRLLVLRRSPDDDYRPGGHDFPGGKVDDGEDPLAGAVRETFEEASIRLDPAALRLVAAKSKAGYNSSYKTNVNVVRLVYATGVDMPQVTVSHEHSGYEWLGVDEAIRTMDHPEGVELLTYLCQNEIALELWRR